MNKRNLKKNDRMENEKITYEFDKGFNRSSKIMEHIIGIDEARLLNTLIYKHNYWIDEDRMVKIKEGDAFWITIPNLQGETNLKPFTIKKAIKKLEELKLIEVYKRGIPAKNHFILNKTAILEFDNKNKDKYEAWLDELYTKAGEDRSRFTAQANKIYAEDMNLSDKNLSTPLMIQQLAEKSPTGELVFNPLVSEFPTVTNNKITKNKINNNSTNRINADIKIELSADDLEIRISDLQQANDQDRSKLSKELFNILCDISSKFKNFSPSDKDFELILAVADSPVECHFLASKILRNARAIIDNRKDCRFGNLFIGIEKMSDNVEMKYSN